MDPLACEEAGITVTLPKPMTSNSKAEGRFGKQDFRYVAEEDVYICPAGERLTYHYTNEENGLVLRRYWTNACQSCALKHSCTTANPVPTPLWQFETEKTDTPAATTRQTNAISRASSPCKPTTHVQAFLQNQDPQPTSG